MSFTAKYRGECIDCDDPILPNQQVEFDDDRNLRHVLCDESRDPLTGGPKPTCSRCFTEMVRRGTGWICGYCDDD